MPRLKRRTALSLFTGAGGLDLGFHAAGFRSVAAIEMDQEAIATLRSASNKHWWENSTVVNSRVEELSDEEIRSLVPKEESLDILIGGPPCQPFSKSAFWHSAGAKGLEDPRAEGLTQYLRVLELTRPQAFLLENVPGIKFSSSDAGIKFLEKNLERLNRSTGQNYSFSVAELNAADFGVPQTRKRVFVVGCNDGAIFRFPSPTFFPLAGLSSSDLFQAEFEQPDVANASFLTAWDAIGDLQGDNNPDLAVKGKWAALLPSIPEGENYLFHTSRGAGVELFGWRTRYWNMLLKLAKNRPAWTITSQPGPAIGPFHWENRRLSVAEMLRIQTFPSTYRIEGSLRSAQKQLGNAVPSLLAEKLAIEIRRQFFGERITALWAPSLAVGRRRPLPPPAMPSPVSPEYVSQIRERAAHPGTARGPAARIRN